jgi:hypothetical protein
MHKGPVADFVASRTGLQGLEWISDTCSRRSKRDRVQECSCSCDDEMDVLNERMGLQHLYDEDWSA